MIFWRKRRARGTGGKDADTGKGSEAGEPGARCGLCGKTEDLKKTECCDQWICDDEHKYVLFSYARNSCARNHRRLTLCGYHDSMDHSGDWRECQKCREELGTEMYVYFGTNEYSFVKLQNPPKFKRNRCRQCGRVIRLGQEGFTRTKEGWFCERCY